MAQHAVRLEVAAHLRIHFGPIANRLMLRVRQLHHRQVRQMNEVLVIFQSSLLTSSSTMSLQFKLCLDRPSRTPSSIVPSREPTITPTVSTTAGPTRAPSANPSFAPSAALTSMPSHAPSFATQAPSISPSAIPVATPSDSPTGNPSTGLPSERPSLIPTVGLRGILPSSSNRPSIAPRVLPQRRSPSAVPSIKTTSLPSLTQQIDPLVTLKFHQQLEIVIENGCAALVKDRSSHQAIQLTTARYLQQSSTNVTYMSCTNDGGVTGVRKPVSLVDTIKQFGVASVYSVIVEMIVYIQLPLPTDVDKVFSEIQARISQEIGNGNFTRTLNSISQALYANTTTTATVTRAMASTFSTYVIQYSPRTLSSVPTMYPSYSSLATRSSAGSTSSTSSSLLSAELIVIIVVFATAIFFALIAGCYGYYRLAKSYPIEKSSQKM